MRDITLRPGLTRIALWDRAGLYGTWHTDAAGCPKLNLLVRADNLDVQAFYEKLGYGRDATISLSKRLISDE